MTLITVEVDQPGHPLIASVLAGRIEAFATKADPFVNAKLLAGTIMAQAWMRDRDLHLQAILDPSGAIVGHAVAQFQANGQGEGRPTVMILQAKADQDVGEALGQAYHQMEAWARERGAVAIVMISAKDPGDMERKYGYKVARRVFHKLLTNGSNGHEG